MHRVLIEIGPLTIYTYGFMLAVAFLAGIWICGRRAPAYGLTRDLIYDSAVPVIVLGLVGAKLAYVLTSLGEVGHSWRDWFSLVRGGFVYYGGVAGGAVGAIWWLNRRRVPPLEYGDVCAPGMGFSLAIGRLGCWLNGCCYGKPAAWGPALPELADGIGRHPVQLYEAAGAAAIGFGLLLVRRPPPEKRGAVFGLFLVGYAVLRFVLEFLRADYRGPELLGVSVSQLLSLVAFAVGAVLAFRRPVARSGA